MRVRQVVVFEKDGRLAALLQPLARESGCSLRESRQEDACLRLLQASGPGALVLRSGRDLEGECLLLERIRLTCLDTRIVVVTDSEHPGVVGLLWDLGAAAVLPAESAAERLAALVERLLDSSEEREGPP